MGNCWQACNTTEGKSLETLGQSSFYLQVSITLWVSKSLSQYSLLDDVKVFPVSPEERQEARQHNCSELQAAWLSQIRSQSSFTACSYGKPRNDYYMWNTSPHHHSSAFLPREHRLSVLLLCIKRWPDTALSKHSCCPASPGMLLAPSCSLVETTSNHPDSPLASCKIIGVYNCESGTFR